MGRKKFKEGKQLGGRFLRFPAVLYESDAYLDLKPVEQQIYIFLCTQYNGDNNGDLTCTPLAMRKKYRMKVSDKTVYRAIRVLPKSCKLYL